MQYVVTNAQMKSAEQECSRRYLSYTQLMENAGKACFEQIIEIASSCEHITILCGSGNNGGDGFVIARLLEERGLSPVIVLVTGEPRSECARYHFAQLSGERILDLCSNSEQCREQIAMSDAVIDCIYGTGFHGKLPQEAASVIRTANHCAVRIAIDVPSGINSDTGEMDDDYFRATHTIVIGAMKKGLIALPCCDCLGERYLVDIGISDDCYGSDYEAIITDSSFRHPFPPRAFSSHKGNYGKLLNISGCLNYNGAAILSTKAALRTGVGLCTLAAPKSVIMAAASAVNETTYLPLGETTDGFIDETAADAILDRLSSVNAVCIGCGMGNSANTRKMVETVIRNASCPIIIDADGINSIADNIDVLKERKGEIILTPHVMEFSRISKKPVRDIQADRIGAAKAFAAQYGVTLVLKGANTVIAGSDATTYLNTCGNPGLAKGGSGDVLAGIISSMAAQGIEPLRAAACGVYCHAYAADLLKERMAMESILPGDVIDILPEVYRS